MTLRHVTLLQTVTILALSFTLAAGCTESSSQGAAPVRATGQLLTDVWVSPPRTTSRTTVGFESVPVWDGTHWWLNIDGRARRYDETGQLADDGGVVLASSALPSLLAAIGAQVVGAWLDQEPDGGFQIRVRAVSPTPGPPTTIPFALGYTFFLASSDSDALLLWSRVFPDGGGETWEASLDSMAALRMPPQQWVAAVQAHALMFDGVRYLALISPPATGPTTVALWGLSGPSGEGRFIRPLSLTLTPGGEFGLGGDARLTMAVGSGSLFQLVIDGGVIGDVQMPPFSSPPYSLSSVFRDGDHLVTYSGSTGVLGIQGAVVRSDGGVTQISDLQPAISSAVNVQYFATMPGVTEGRVLQPWFYNLSGGRTGWLTALALDGGAQPTPVAQSRVLPGATIATLPTLAAIGDHVVVGWAGEVDNNAEPFFFANHVAATGPLHPVPLVIGDSSWPPLPFVRLEGPVVASSDTEAIEAWSSTLTLRVRLLDADGGLPLPPRILSTAGSFRSVTIAYGADVFMVIGVGISSNKAYLFDRNGTLLNSGGGTALPLPLFTTAASLGFDGTRFHLLAVRGDGVVEWLVLDPSATVLSSTTLAASGSGQAVSGNGYALALLSTPAQGNTVLRLFADGGTTTVAQFGSYEVEAHSKKLALLSTSTDEAVVAIASSPGVQWARIDADGGVTLTAIEVSPAPSFIALTAIASGQMVLARDEPSLSTAIHLDFLTNGADGVSCGGPFDCANLGCFGGLCCTPPCSAPDAGVDAGVGDAGAVDAGTAPDAGSLPDASVPDAGPSDDDAGAPDSGQAPDGGMLTVVDAGSTSDGGDPGGKRVMVVGCSCGATEASLGVWGLLGIALVARRGRQKHRPW